MPLTDAEIRRATPRPKPWKLFDGGGLDILINPNGSKLWRLKYRHRGKPPSGLIRSSLCGKPGRNAMISSAP
ncbi:MAG: Arm DNA-binding domain-containing protein [Rhodomicrobium sp.]